MAVVTIERKITKPPVRAEVYFAVDESGKSQPIKFVNGVAKINLPSGEAVIVVGFAGNVGSKVSLIIKTPVGTQKRSVSIKDGVSVFEARFIKV